MRVLAGLVFNLAVFASVIAEPFIPGSDAEVLERLAVAPGDPALRALQSQLLKRPENLVLATRVAQGYLELGRVTGDPRYAGYSEAALTPWWHLDDPPSEVLVLRAILRQRLHEFDAALADLATVLGRNPHYVQARLTRAAVLQVKGAYEDAREDCQALKSLSSELVWTACLTGVTALASDLDRSYRQLRAMFQTHPPHQPELQGWVLTSLAEMAARSGRRDEAEQHFRAALAVHAADTYLLGTEGTAIEGTPCPG
jgi:tetratricopeptide (TPR) repeat protein